VETGFKTDTGRVRTANEDCLLVLPKYGLYAVCDGVGGQNSGEIASRKAVTSIEEFYTGNPIAEAVALDGNQRHEWFKSYFLRCFEKLNNDIRSLAASGADMEGMATTAVVCFINAGTLYVTNIGDSRAWLIREEKIMQLTEDHSYVNTLVTAGTLSPDEAREHPKKNLITRALGASYQIEPDFYYYKLNEGDMILLTTDGLHGLLPEDEILEIVVEGDDLNRTCRKLVRAANERGGNDNITVILATL